MMKAVLVIDMPTNCSKCKLSYLQGIGESICNAVDWDDRPSWCPLNHPMKYASNEFYIYDTQYLMKNLDREIELLKGTKAFKEIMEKRNESNISD